MKIFVTVGTHKKGFERLIRELDRLQGEKKLKGKVFAQVGSTSKFKPHHLGFTEILPLEDFQKKISEADLIISHGGAGTIIDVLNQRKPLVLVPRLKKFKECVDDHQLDLCRALEREKKVLSVYNIKDLLKTIEKAKKFKFKFHARDKNLIGEVIEKALKEWQ
jgi:UDP-N-acetylglucosamine transferase subunit ALG13